MSSSSICSAILASLCCPVRRVTTSSVRVAVTPLGQSETASGIEVTRRDPQERSRGGWGGRPGSTGGPGPPGRTRRAVSWPAPGGRTGEVPRAQVGTQSGLASKFLPYSREKSPEESTRNAEKARPTETLSISRGGGINHGPSFRQHDPPCRSRRSEYPAVSATPGAVALPRPVREPAAPGAEDRPVPGGERAPSSGPGIQMPCRVRDSTCKLCVSMRLPGIGKARWQRRDGRIFLRESRWGSAIAGCAPEKWGALCRTGVFYRGCVPARERACLPGAGSGAPPPCTFALSETAGPHRLPRARGRRELGPVLARPVDPPGTAVVPPAP